MSSITLTGLGADYFVPGNYFQANFAQGDGAGFSGALPAILVGNMTSDGDATADTVIYGPDTAIAVSSQSDVDARFGARSEIARMFKRFTSVNKTTPLYMLAVTESGGAPATGTITFSGTASGTATVRVWLEDEFVDTTIYSGDNATTVGDAVALAINSRPDWPATAGNSSGTITLTAAQKGLRGNWLRYSAQIIAPASVTTTVSTAGSLMTGGSSADDWTTALATLLPKWFYYIVSAAEDASTLGDLLDQVNTQALPLTGFLQRVFAGSIDSLSNAIAVATDSGVNNPRAEIVWQYLGDVPPAELAALYAGAMSLEEQTLPPRMNFDGYGSAATDIWPLKAPRSGAAPTEPQINIALHNGLSPVRALAGGGSNLVSRVTTKSFTGSASDYRIRDAHKVTVVDRLIFDLKAKKAAAFAGKMIANDPLPNQKPTFNSVSPRDDKALTVKLLEDYAELGMIDASRLPAIIAGCQFVRETSPATRLSSRIPAEIIDCLHQTATRVDQVAFGGA